MLSKGLQNGFPPGVYVSIELLHGLTPYLERNCLQRRGLRTADGKRPTNLDLFLRLDEVITNLEQADVAVGFWQVPRAYNHRADRLAKLATQ
jgi:ribonuclease HI